MLRSVSLPAMGVLLFSLGLCPLAPSVLADAPEASSAPAASTVSVEGVWAGEVIYRPAAREMEIFVSFEKEAAEGEAAWKVTTAIPYERLWGFPMREVSVEGRKVAFRFNEEEVFEGEMDAEGEEISGSFSGHGHPHPFVLRRHGGPLPTRADMPAPSSLTALWPSPQPLIERFDADLGKPRLLMLVSPSCAPCVQMARAVQRHVLDTLPQADVAVYVVWLPLFGEDGLRLAEAKTVALPDARAAHFWDQDLAVAKAFKVPLGFPDIQEAAWDVVLLYGPDRQWGGGGPEGGPLFVPPPDGHWHNMEGDFQVDNRLDARVLASRLAELLGLGADPLLLPPPPQGEAPAESGSHLHP